MFNIFFYYFNSVSYFFQFIFILYSNLYFVDFLIYFFLTIPRIYIYQLYVIVIMTIMDWVT